MDLSQTSKDLLVVTPSDEDPCPGIGFVFVGGDCAVLTAHNEERIIPEAFAGIVHPQVIKKVLETGTTATAVLVYRG